MQPCDRNVIEPSLSPLGLVLDVAVDRQGRPVYVDSVQLPGHGQAVRLPTAT